MKKKKSAGMSNSLRVTSRLGLLMNSSSGGTIALLFKYSGALMTFLIVFVMFGVAFTVFVESMPSISKFGLSFLTSKEWNSSKDEFGALNSIYGSIVCGFLVMSISVPFSIGVAIYLSEMAHERFRGPIGISVELLAAVPSVVYGMVGLVYIVPFIGSVTDSIGMGILSASLVLSVMVMPFMAALMKDSLRAVPGILRESAYALGATRFEVIKDILFPFASTGVVGSIILAVSRVLGETMAVTLLLGGTQKIPGSLVEASTNIPSTIASNFGEADSEIYVSSLFYLALILLSINGVVIFLARFFTNSRKRGA